MEATYYDNIMEQQRLEPEFFRVGFYGRKFPFFLRVSQSYTKYGKETGFRVAFKALNFSCGVRTSAVRFIFYTCASRNSFLSELKDVVHWEHS